MKVKVHKNKSIFSYIETVTISGYGLLLRSHLVSFKSNKPRMVLNQIYFKLNTNTLERTNVA